MPQAALRPHQPRMHRRGEKQQAAAAVAALPSAKSETGLARFVAPLGLASPKIRARILQKLSGLVLAMAFPIGLAASWFWSFVHEAELPLPFQVAVDQNALLPQQRNQAVEITPLKVPLQDNAPVAGLSRDPRLIENSIHGAVPRIASDGLKPRHVYARPFTDPANRPRIAIVVTGLGLGLAITDRALAMLPPTVALAFSPYGQDLVRQVQTARADNRELLLQIPMEPYDFPANDGGPAMLAADAPPDTNNDRLLWSLARMTGYVGVTNLQGGRFRDSAAMARFVDQTEKRGLFYIDDGVGRSKSGGLRRAHVTIDPLAPDAAFAELEKLALAEGAAIGIVAVTPVMIDRIAAWAKEIESRGLVFAPVSAVADRAPQ